MKNEAEIVYVAYVQQPVPQEGVVELRVFRGRDDAVAFLRDAYERFLRCASDAEVRDWGEDVGENIAVGVARAARSSWFGKVVARIVAD